MSFIDRSGPSFRIDNASKTAVVDFARSVRSTEILGTESNVTMLYGAPPDQRASTHAERAKIAKENMSKWLEAAGVKLEGVPGFQTSDPLKGSDVLAALGLNERVSSLDADRKAAIVSRMETDTRPPLEVAARPRIAVVMGQGAIGRLDRYRFCSDSFYSCMPVLIYNSMTKVGGLFHVPCPAVENGLPKYHDQGVPEALDEMVRLVRPTEITVRPGSSALATGFRQEEEKARNAAKAVCEDIRRLATSAKLECAVKFDGHPCGLITVTARDGNLYASIEAPTRGANAVVSRNNDLPDAYSSDVLSWSAYIHEADSSAVGDEFFLQDLKF